MQWCLKARLIFPETFAIRAQELGDFLAALVDAEKLGTRVTLFVTTGAAEHSQQWLSNFADAVRQLAEVIELVK
jgi:hypothetical protein